MSILVPILVSLLVEPELLGRTGKISQTLHEQVLAKLMKVCPAYPAHFRSVMQASPDLRVRLEAAVKAQQQQAQDSRASAAALSLKNASSQPAKPAIKLKMDFSNFSG